MCIPTAPDHINALAEQFLESYYHAVNEKNAASLGAKYSETSIFSWQSENFIGAQKILDKIFDLRRLGELSYCSFSAQLRDNILVVMSDAAFTESDEGNDLHFTECFVATVSRDCNIAGYGCLDRG
ncbi:hypothetical protein MKX08_002330 [Trichoderma sp. CBMAI-0020]|nr:hypothetical protein MKX08_002330 [Trichoderma sp. CBMAI-0020]